jgi:hypothetical protein
VLFALRILVGLFLLLLLLGLFGIIVPLKFLRLSRRGAVILTLTSFAACLALTLYGLHIAQTMGLVPTNKVSSDSAVQQPTKPHSLYFQGPLDLNTENVGPHFLGHHIGAIADYVKEANRPKEEFESSSEYEKRKAEFLTQPLLGMPLDSYLVFTRDEIDTPLDTVANLFTDFVYDADKQAFGVMVTGTRDYGYPGKAPTFIMLMSGDGDGLSYDLQPELGRRGQKFDYLSTLPMPSAKAKVFKPFAKVAIVCRLIEPWYRNTTVSVFRHSPFEDHNYVDKPVHLLHVKIEQIWVIDGSTGEVVQKIRWPSKAGKQL